MDHIDYDIDLTSEELDLKAAAHKFAKEVMRPAGIEIDRMTPEYSTSCCPDQRRAGMGQHGSCRSHRTIFHTRHHRTGIGK